jgi:hypothetical protein
VVRHAHHEDSGRNPADCLPTRKDTNKQQVLRAKDLSHWIAACATMTAEILIMIEDKEKFNSVTVTVTS